MALKSRSYIFDIDLVKLSLGIFFFLSCLIESIFHQLSGSTFIFVKNTHKKAANLMFCLISPVAQSPAWYVEGQCIWGCSTNRLVINSSFFSKCSLINPLCGPCQISGVRFRVSVSGFFLNKKCI